MIFFVPWMQEEIDITDPPERSEHPTRFAAWHELKMLESIGSKRQIQTALYEFISGASSSLEIGLKAGSTTAKLICMCREWVTSILPYVISKRNSVNYGLLPDHMWREDQKMAKVIGRKLCAVPYVGKDSPSDASEFSSPEVIIGFTILSYRYEGLRRIDAAVLLLGPQPGPKVVEPVSDEVTDYRGLLKQCSDEKGPVSERTAWLTYDSWLELAAEARRQAGTEGTIASQGGAGGKGGRADDKPALERISLDLIDMENNPAHRRIVFDNIQHVPQGELVDGWVGGRIGR